MNVSDEIGSASPANMTTFPSEAVAAAATHFGVVIDPHIDIARVVHGDGSVTTTSIGLPPDVNPSEVRMRKLSRAMMPAWKVRQLKVGQDGLCALCGKPIDLTIEREGVVDHDHDTGEIRGVLHRSCNSGEGKVANAAGSWIAKSMKYPAIIASLERLLAYYKRPGTGLIYPTFVDAATQARKSADKRNLAAKTRRATIKAQRALRDQRPKE